MQGLQLQKMCSRAHSRCGPFPVPDDGSAVVVSSSNGELWYTVVSHDHIVMCNHSHQFKITVCSCSLRVV